MNVKQSEPSSLADASEWDKEYSHAYNTNTDRETAMCGKKRNGAKLHDRPTRKLCPICDALIKYGHPQQ